MQLAVVMPHSEILGDQQRYLGKDCYLPHCLSDIMNDTTADSLSMAKLLVEQTTRYSPAVLVGSQVVEQARPPPVTPTSDESSPNQASGWKADDGEQINEIIRNLYLGDRDVAIDPSRLADYGIQAVVCCNRELEFPSSQFSPNLEYYRVDVEDMGREPIELFFPEATEFIHTQLSQERPVLVHCKAGVSRSSSVVLAYLVEYHGYSLHDAFFKVLKLRPTITPNLGFMDKLRDYEEEKLGKGPTIDIHKYDAWFQARGRCLEPDLRPE
jgi:hypothetical protein